jgi:hypothetical protein
MITRWVAVNRILGCKSIKYTEKLQHCEQCVVTFLIQIDYQPGQLHFQKHSKNKKSETK